MSAASPFSFKLIQLLLTLSLALPGISLAGEQRPRREYELMALKSFHPETVKLNKKTIFRTAGSNRTAFTMPAGKAVKVVSADLDGLLVEAVTAQTKVPYEITNFFEQTEKSFLEDHAQRLKQVVEWRQEQASPLVKEALDRIRAGSLSRDDVETALDLFPWPQDRVATMELAEQVLTFLNLSQIRTLIDKPTKLVVFGRTQTGARLEFLWEATLPRNQFFIRAPQVGESKVKRGFSYEIPEMPPLMMTAAQNTVPPSRHKPTGSIFDVNPDRSPKPTGTTKPPPDRSNDRENGVQESHADEKPTPPPNFSVGRNRTMLSRGELNKEGLRNLLTFFRREGKAPSKGELVRLLDFLKSKREVFSNYGTAPQATAYFRKAYMTVQGEPEEDAYTFSLYNGGFWSSQPITFTFKREWFGPPITQPKSSLFE